MSVIGITVLIMAALAVVACCAGLLSLRSKTKRFAELQQTSEQQIRQLTSAVRSLEARLAELAQAQAPAPPAPKAVPVAAPVALPVTAPAAKGKEEEITPELLVLMASAVTVFLGKTVRIRSAKRLQSPYEIVNPWSQQGRVFVQASHNLRSR